MWVCYKLYDMTVLTVCNNREGNQFHHTFHTDHEFGVLYYVTLSKDTEGIANLGYGRDMESQLVCCMHYMYSQTWDTEGIVSRPYPD